jgi:ADP-heptose:LPS heptosyltransferase
MVGVGDLEMPAAFREKLQSFDFIVSWYGANRPEFREALAAVGVPCRFHAALPPSGYDGHAIDFFARQVGAPEGLAPRIETRPAERRDSVIVHPFSGSARKNWPLCFFRRLAAQLSCAVEWTAGPEEELPEATRFDNLADLANWIAGARLYIGNDSGITHLAAAAGIPTLALFGPASPQTWTPRGPNVTIVPAQALESLLVDTVLDAANRLLG